MNIILCGALGRMGQEVIRAAEAAKINIVYGVDVAYIGGSSAIPLVNHCEKLPLSADVLIDFSKPDGLFDLLHYCRKKNLPCVLCTTGYTDTELKSIDAAAEHIAILRSANMSLGINVMEQLVAMASKALGESYDIEIVEKHHRMKADSPSGTALMLNEAAKNSTQNVTKPIFGRYGRAEKRERGDIGLHAVRGGSVTGEHEAGFYGDGEQVILTHRAESRALFAQGAIRAARFLAGKPAGLYSMRDVVMEMLVP